MPPKRPIHNVFASDDDDGAALDKSQNGTPPKKPRPDAAKATVQRAGIAPPPAVPSASTPAQNGAQNSIQAQVAAAKARAQALMSAMQNKSAAPGSSAAPPRPAAPSTAGGPPRFAPVASTQSSAAPSPAMNATLRPAPPSSAAPRGPSSIQAQLEAARARVQAQMAALNSKNEPAAPQPSTSSTATAGVTRTASSSTSSATTAASASASSSKAPTGIHPLLLSNDLPYKPKTLDSSASKPSASTSRARSSHVPPEANPYLQASREAAEEVSRSGEGPRARSMRKGFQFHKPGRHVHEAEELRREQQMEELRRRIEESARKAGTQDSAAEEKRLVRAAPPDIEWWDVNLVRERTYECVPDVSVDAMLEAGKQASSGVLLYGEASPIDQYVQHPIPIPAPSDQVEVKPRGLMLTKKEQRKLRKQRRAAELQDKRDRIKMGLLPPEPPKVKLSNLMRVLTSEAVADPTKIEARVRREIAARQEAHERHNAERKLTPEQRREKLERRKQLDQAKGLFCAVFRVRHLISPRHKFKVRQNALDHALTGITVFHPSMALVVVEGSAKALKAYKRLMTVRIDWTDPGEPRDPDSDEDKDKDKDKEDAPRSGFRTYTTSQDDVDWASNTCELVFEGPIRERSWAGRGFRAVACETDQAARDALGSTMQGYWDVARRAALTLDEGI